MCDLRVSQPRARLKKKERRNNRNIPRLSWCSVYYHVELELKASLLLPLLLDRQDNLCVCKEGGANHTRCTVVSGRADQIPSD